VLLEAMAAGKPVVASDIEGYAGIVTHGQECLLFPRKDIGGLAQALGTLIRDPQLRNKLGSQGRQTVEQYRWDRVAAQVEDYYKDCMSLANGRTRKRADKRGHTSIR
jgi:phosphatidylinositol alpha-mannosyltransferase